MVEDKAIKTGRQTLGLRATEIIQTSCVAVRNGRHTNNGLNKTEGLFLSHVKQIQE